MEKYLPIEKNPGLVRDLSSNGVVNVNETMYNQYLNNKRLRDVEVEVMKKIENDIECLKADLCSIKKLITNMYKNESK